MSPDEFWKELGRRSALLRNIYATYRIPLESASPLAQALAEARDLADGKKVVLPPSDQALMKAVESAQTIYVIAESVERCLAEALDISRHLKQMATGTIDYGSPGSAGQKNIYLKDFEYELFIASALVTRGLKPVFLPDRNDPTGEMQVNGLIIECKHPDSEGQLMRNISKFGRKLMESNRHGIFAVGLEDACQLGDVVAFETQSDYDRWLEQKQDLMEEGGRKRALHAYEQERVLGLVTTQAKLLMIADNSQFSRLGNSMLFDDKESFSPHAAEALQIAKAFNPSPIRYSEVRELMPQRKSELAS